ncbi:membrane protein [Microlunatus endophyticus]|uniref:Membrane protein n=1 Tax=Microlunatus endophyticus TaxID=1716077 RepID=A0A917W756_9ACTN|nr:pilus assembly protein TadG-related protein [Microlunatus endophyticus]GGL71317.1 membrane protein [Microlunatus endophyticus]
MRSALLSGRERGQAVSIMVLGFVAALLMVAGLVVDGGQKAAAMNRAETLAAGAARAGADAGAGSTLGTASDTSVSAGQARISARNYLAAAGGDIASSRVQVNGDQVSVHIEIRVTTVFLSLIHINTLRATGDATARVVPN